MDRAPTSFSPLIRVPIAPLPLVTVVYAVSRPIASVRLILTSTLLQNNASRPHISAWLSASS